MAYGFFVLVLFDIQRYKEKLTYQTFFKIFSKNFTP